MNNPVIAYHFFGDHLRDRSPVPADGERITASKKHLKLCVYGLHASRHPLDALKHAPGPNLAIVELTGIVLEGADKLCAKERTIIERVDATALLRQFAREQATSVLHLWDAPGVVREYLETGDESLRAAAEDAAWAAAEADVRSAARSARSAAWAAAAEDAPRSARAAYRSAVRSAAWAADDAAWAAARARFKVLVEEAFAL